MEFLVLVFRHLGRFLKFFLKYLFKEWSKVVTYIVLNQKNVNYCQSYGYFRSSLHSASDHSANFMTVRNWNSPNQEPLTKGHQSIFLYFPF